MTVHGYGRKHSLTVRTLRLAAIRIGMVSICAGILSYLVNLSSLEAAIRAQLLLSTEQIIQRESLRIRRILRGGGSPCAGA